MVKPRIIQNKETKRHRAPVLRLTYNKKYKMNCISARGMFLVWLRFKQQFGSEDNLPRIFNILQTLHIKERLASSV